MIRRESFVDLLSGHAEDFEKFHYIKDQILLNRKFVLVNEKCYSCGGGDHLINRCPYLNLNIEMLKLVERG
jgi:hypothetical protein